MDEVVCYVKNQGMSFTIPYALNGEEKSCLPDFIVRIDDGHGAENPLNLIIEVTGQKKPDKEAKAATARTLWVPAINNHTSASLSTGSGFGRWSYVEDFDPWNAQTAIREFLSRPARKEGAA